MFKSARVKLTLWYILIISTITVLFSAFVYVGAAKASERALHNQQARLERKLTEEPTWPKPPNKPFVPMDEESIEELRLNLLTMLLYINLSIIMITGGLSYLLAGITLRPIEKMVEAQKRFISDAAHELKTPLAAMKADIEVSLRDKKIREVELKDCLKNAVTDIDKLNLLVSALIAESRYQKDDYSNMETLMLDELLHNTIKNLEGRAKQKEIDIQAKLEQVQYTGNKKALQELFTILIDNGIKYGEKGGYLMVSLEKVKNRPVISFKDNGIGISDEDINKVFDRFYRVDTARSELNEEGFGLGLAIAKEIVTKHKGKIGVDSTLGEGTTFTITL